MGKGRKSGEQECVLVTGGAGYIGSHVVRDLGENGFWPIVLDDLSTGNREAVLSGELVVGQVQDAEVVKALIRKHAIRSVMHFAARIVVSESMEKPFLYYENNAANSLRLIQACVEEGVERFIFSSTAAVYGLPEKVPVNEESPLLPINPYGCSKMMTEMVLRDAARAYPRFRYVSLRYFNVVGADAGCRIGQKYQKPTHLLTLTLRTALGLFPCLYVFGTDYPTPDGTAIRDYIHIDDLAQAHLLALDFLEQRKESQVFNCGYGRGFSVREVVDAVKRELNLDFPVQHSARREGDPPVLVADATRIHRELGWSPCHADLAGIIRSAWNWECKLLGKK